MGTTMQFYGLNPDDVAWVRTNPGTLDVFLEYGNNLRGLYRECRAEGLSLDDNAEWISVGLLKKIVFSDTAARLADDEVGGVDLYHAWGVLAFALSQEDQSVGRRIFEGGEGLQDNVTRILVPEEVRGLSKALEGIPWEDLLPHLVPDKLEQVDVHPEIWRAGVDEMHADVEDAFNSLAEFFFDCAERGHAVVVRTTL